ncbi:hypothetical protein K440DRAFT_614573 [Wilcoxina mikolae CBS 423.85]|nr:hypothetical protein K440DRAFT_614573 [Wilcoxina mikolae CBS 423.85]
MSGICRGITTCPIGTATSQRRRTKQYRRARRKLPSLLNFFARKRFDMLSGGSLRRSYTPCKSCSREDLLKVQQAFFFLPLLLLFTHPWYPEPALIQLPAPLAALVEVSAWPRHIQHEGNGCFPDGAHNSIPDEAVTLFTPHL